MPRLSRSRQILLQVCRCTFIKDKKIIAALLGIIIASSAFAETFRGHLYISPEGEAFYPCENKTGYWLLAPEKIRNLLISEGLKKSSTLSEQGVFVELDGKLGRKTKKSDGEFVSAYPAFIYIKKVVSIREVTPNDCNR